MTTSSLSGPKPDTFVQHVESAMASRLDPAKVKRQLQETVELDLRILKSSFEIAAENERPYGKMIGIIEADLGKLVDTLANGKGGHNSLFSPMAPTYNAFHMIKDARNTMLASEALREAPRPVAERLLAAYDSLTASALLQYELINQAHTLTLEAKAASTGVARWKQTSKGLPQANRKPLLIFRVLS